MSVKVDSGESLVSFGTAAVRWWWSGHLEIVTVTRFECGCGCRELRLEMTIDLEGLNANLCTKTKLFL